MGENEKTESNCDATLTQELSPLRDEIRKSEEARLDFLKYKLIAVATLASVAFGLGSWGSSKLGAELRYVLMVIPFVCVYVDALCYHNNLRILVIAKYLRCHGDSYENFLGKWQQVLEHKPRGRYDKPDSTFLDKRYQNLVDFAKWAFRKPQAEGIGLFFEMEDWVINISTKAMALLVALSGLFLCSPAIQQVPIFCSGVLGFLLSWLMKRQYEARRDGIARDGCDEIRNKYPVGK